MSTIIVVSIKGSERAGWIKKEIIQLVTARNFEDFLVVDGDFHQAIQNVCHGRAKTTGCSDDPLGSM